MDRKMKDMIDNITSRYDELYSIAAKMSDSLRDYMESGESLTGDRSLCLWVDFTRKSWEYEQQKKSEHEISEMMSQLKDVVENRSNRNNKSEVFLEMKSLVEKFAVKNK
jgi:hypothetical protein